MSTHPDNPDPSEGPWGGGVMPLHGGAQSSPRPDAVRDNRCGYEVHEGRMQTGCRTAYAGSRLKLPTIREGTAWKASLPAVLGKTRRTECVLAGTRSDRCCLVERWGFGVRCR